MNKRRTTIGLIVAAVLIAGVSVYAQMSRPYHSGTVWNISFIRIKPGMDTAYLNYLSKDWKAEQEALKKDGQILSLQSSFSRRSHPR
jgi:hypothetical protein